MLASSAVASSANSGTCFRIETTSTRLSSHQTINCDRPCVALAVHDPDGDRPGQPRAAGRQLLGPLDREYAAGGELVEAKVVDLPGIVQAVEVGVEKCQAPAAVLLHQRERRAAHLGAFDAQPFSQPLHECR